MKVLLFLATLVASTPFQGKVEHIVVLMEENRSFDHMLGWMKKGGPNGDTRVNGLTGKECNPKSLKDPTAGKICVTDVAKDDPVTGKSCPYDPDHTHGSTTGRIYGCLYHNNATGGTTPCTNHAMTDGKVTMDGFVQYAEWEHRDGVNEMTMWAPENVPIITTLAKEFANFDAFFCAHPGPTYPNRQFVHSGTAHGETDDEVPHGGFPQKTIYRQLEESNITWAMYYEDALTWANFLDDIRRPSAKENLLKMDKFYSDAKAGTLPAYSFVEPRITPLSKQDPSLPSFGLSNHQHPTASVREGERLMKNMYEALRNGPKWNTTMFIITYDEHGGFYDHVHPPQGSDIPSPDGIPTIHGFTYQRLGIRIPTIVLSPFIPKGTLVSEPPASQKPFPNSAFELSSIPATVAKGWGLGGDHLTKRTAWAATFEHLLTLDTPRTDCPKTLPVVPPPAPGQWRLESDMPLGDHRRATAKFLCEEMNMEPAGCSAHLKTNRDFTPWIAEQWAKWMRRS